MKNILIVFTLTLALAAGIIFSDRAHAQFPPPLTGPIVPTDTYVVEGHGFQINSVSAKDVPLTFAGTIHFLFVSTATLSNGTTVSSGFIDGHGRTPSGAGKIAGTWRQEIDNHQQLTGAILLTFGCGTEQFEWLVYFTASSGKFIDRSLYRRLSGDFAR